MSELVPIKTTVCLLWFATGLSQASVSRILHSVVSVLADKAKQEVRIPSNELECRRAAGEFHRIRNFPRVIRAIDCKIPYHSRDTLNDQNNNFMLIEVFVYFHKEWMLNLSCVALSFKLFLW